jgi:proteasome lid subunit RPN8/RPN11
MKNAQISALASMKMLKHSIKGIKSGIAKQGVPVEVMGLLIGTTMANGDVVVQDVLPLPIEGEAAFVTASAKVDMFMIDAGDRQEQHRQEGFVGWYHSHPLATEKDVNFPLWFLSATDMTTQNATQMVSQTWTAIVVDPFRSMAKQRPEIGVFRAVHPGAPDRTVQPNGEPVVDLAATVQRWHSTWNRYYMLNHTFFMSSTGMKFVNAMSRNSLWIRALAATQVTEREHKEGVPKRLDSSIKALNRSSGNMGSFGEGRRGRGRGMKMSSSKQADDPYCTAASDISDIVVEQCCGHAMSMGKQIMFNILQRQAQRSSSSSSSSSDAKAN